MKRYSCQFKSVKLLLCFAALLLVAKPFLGFSIFSRVHPPSEENIFVKAFTKRKQEYVEGSNFNMEYIQKKLAEPVNKYSLLFIAFLAVLFPSLFKNEIAFTNNLVKRHKLVLSLSGTCSQRTGSLVI